MDILQYFDRYKKLGEASAINNTKLIGKALHIGKEAWLHELYVGLTFEEISLLEKELEVSLPADFKKFLSITNGLAFFVTTLSIYGVRRINSRNYDIREPFSIISKNENERPVLLPKHYVLIGSYFADSSKLVLDSVSGKIFRYNKQFNIIQNEWGNFNTFLSLEIPRIDACFDDNGILKTDIKDTLPEPNLI
jgi:hypothetical protein